MVILKNNNIAKAFKANTPRNKTDKVQTHKVQTHKVQTHTVQTSREKRLEKFHKSRNGVILQRKPRVQNTQTPLSVDAKKELYKTVKNLIINSDPNTPPHRCSLSRDAYYLNLFVLCCVDGIHDTNNENRFKSGFTGKTKFTTMAPDFFRAVGREIYEEFRNSYININQNDSIPEETKKFFENISEDKKPYVTHNGDPAKDIEDYTILFLINYDNINQNGDVKYNGIETYDKIKKVYNNTKTPANESNSNATETNVSNECNNKLPKRFCSQNGNEWGTNKNWSEILSTFGKEHKKELIINQDAVDKPIFYNGDDTFNKIDMGVTATLIDGLSGKIGNLTNVYNNSIVNGTAPCIAVELGNMNICFNISEGGIVINNNFLEIKSKFIIAKKSKNGARENETGENVTSENETGENVTSENETGENETRENETGENVTSENETSDNKGKFDILNTTLLNNDDNDFNEFTNEEFDNYKILYEIKLNRTTTFKTTDQSSVSVSEATYLYELYPTLTVIKIAEEMENKNRGTYGVNGLPQQEDNLGQHVADFVKNKFIENNEKYKPADCIKIIRKAICDYFQSLQNLIVFGSNSIVKSDVNSSIKYFPNNNNIIKYEYNDDNNNGFQIRTNTHRDRPASSLSGFLIKNLLSGRNEYYHTSYTTKGANFFFSNKDGIVLALFEPKNMISQIKTQYKRQKKNGGGVSSSKIFPQDNSSGQKAEEKKDDISETTDDKDSNVSSDLDNSSGQKAE